MTTSPGLDSFPQPTSHCVVRKQADEYLIYNPHTDELHLLPPTGFFVYQLCDGLHTVEEIAGELAEGLDASATAVRQPLMRFLGELVERGILEAGSA